MKYMVICQCLNLSESRELLGGKDNNNENDNPRLLRKRWLISEPVGLNGVINVY